MSPRSRAMRPIRKSLWVVIRSNYIGRRVPKTVELACHEAYNQDGQRVRITGGDFMSDDDLPMISTDSTQVEITPVKEAKVGAPEPIRPPAKPAGAPAPAAQADPRKGSEVRKAGPVAPARPANDPSASRPAAPSVRPAPAAAASEDEDPEKLLREYADRQKTKMVRLEQQVVEYKKIVGERDAFKAKVDALTRELQD